MKKLGLAVAFAAAVFAAGCGGGGGGGNNDAGNVDPQFDCTGATKVTTAQLQTDIIANTAVPGYCVSCHNGVNQTLYPGDMSTATATQALVGKASSYATTSGSTLKWADPNNPQNSSMYLKILDNSPHGPKNEAVGARMPQGGPYLSATQIAEVKNWICTGATAQ